MWVLRGSQDVKALASSYVVWLSEQPVDLDKHLELELKATLCQDRTHNQDTSYPSARD